MNRVLCILAAVLMAAPSVYAQSAPISGIAINSFGQPVPFAPIRVCNVTSTGTPCSPVSTIYLDYGLTQPIANPTTADANGNYTLFVGSGSPNLYIVQVGVAQGVTWSYVQSGPGGGGGGGNVSSVGLTMPNIFSVAGSPVTSSGTIGVTLATETANTVFAGPTSGGAAAPTFRGLTAADMPLTVAIVSGAVTTGDCAQFTSPNLISDSGSACGGGGGSGVTAINGNAGSFTFTGNVTCTGVTCNFTGGGGSGGVNPGVVAQLPYYDTTSTVRGDAFLSDTAPTNATSGLLTYTGPGGASFSTSNGGIYTLSTANASSTVTALDSQINLLASTTLSQASATNPGLITIQTTDTTGMANAANIVISANENVPDGTTSSGTAGIVSISASGGGTGPSSGNITLTADGNESNTSGTISLTANGGDTTGLGGNIYLVTSSVAGGVQSGEILLNASNATAPLVITASNLSVDATGNTTFGGNVVTGQSLRSGVLTNGNCLTADSLGNIVSTTSPCNTGGGGGISGAGTAGYVAVFSGSGASTSIGNSHLDDGLTTASRLTSTEPLNIADGSGTGGALTATLGTAPTASGTTDTLWADTGGRWKMNNANNGALIINGIAAAGTANDCVKLAANGIDLADAGTACAGGNSFSSVIFTGSTSGSVTVTAQAVAGTPTIQWPTVSGQVALTTAEVLSFNATPTFTPGDTMSRMTTLTGNVTTFTLGATASGQAHALCWQQGSGSFTVTPPSNVHGFAAIGNTSGKWNCQNFMYDAADSIWLAISSGVLNQ